jgi:hypothetical protein
VLCTRNVVVLHVHVYLHSGWIFNTLLEFILHFVKLADFGLRYGKMIHSVKEKVYGISILLEKNAVKFFFFF